MKLSVAVQPARVAVLLATRNGAQFIEPQIRSLGENATRFTLHWLDDHSTDNTRDAVRAAALAWGIELSEWQQPRHQGLPGAFFQLIEHVDADIYLFCDQDDLWQRGKIDATVANLLPDVVSPVLCFSDPLIFRNDQAETLCRFTEVFGITTAANLQESRAFMHNPATGHTIGFTRPLRDIFLRHKDIANAYAFVHDWWMYLIALASGPTRMLSNVPTTLWRLHGNNTLGGYISRSRRGIDSVVRSWQIHQTSRRWLARQAEGFVLAAPTLPPGPRLDRLVELARLVATIDQRQPAVKLARLAGRGMLPAAGEIAFWLAATCLLCDAKT